MKKGRLLSVVLSASMLLSSIALPAFALTFNDVESDATVSWAKDSITKMTDAGYIKGYEDGTFRPYRAITKIESLILMSRMLGYENKQFSDVASSATTAYKSIVSKYNTTYANEISYLLYCGVLKESDLLDYASAANANTQLLRYQAAILMSKLMGADSEAKAYTVSTATYADDSAIPATAKSYVEYVTANNIMNGMDKTSDGKSQFSPLTSLTRAQMATLLARMMDKLDLKYVSGSVDSTSSSSVTIGGTKLGLTKDTKVYINGGTASTSDISEGADASAVSIMKNALAVQTEEVQKSTIVYGIITRKTDNADGKKLTIADYEDENNSETYTLKDNCKITVDGAKGTLADLSNKDFVKVTITGSKISEISTEDKNFNVKGVLVSTEYDDDNHVYMNIGDNNGDNVQQYVVSSKGATITRDGEETEFGSLSKGDKVTVKLNYGKVVSVTAKGDTVGFTGLLKEIIISNNPSLTITVDGKDKTYKLRSDAKITVSGSAATIYDLRPNITVTGTLDSSEIKTVSASTVAVNEKGEMTGTVTGKNTTYKVITIKDDDGNTQSVYYNNNTKFLSSNGSNSTVKALENGSKITVTGADKNGVFEATIIIVR
ncbi:MAG: S-layer homology domain-containing protein [Clostridiales bacterium]|nr:S-layer homology domain-containing protein [Clostridiales bacterium]